MCFYFQLIFILNFFFCVKCDHSNDYSLIKLDCETGESRTYSYLSKTKLWGPTSENVLLEAQIDVYCMGKIRNGDGYKYLVKVSNIQPDISHNNENFIKRKSRSINSDQKNERKSAFEEWLLDTWQLIKKYIFRQSDNINSFELSIGTGTCYNKYETSKESKIKWMIDSESDYNKELSLPFEFIQKSDGSVSEIRFSLKEKDETVKNFKKHIADTFATQLDPKKNETFESSPIGQHISFYSFYPSREEVENDFKLADSALLKVISSFFKPFYSSENSKYDSQTSKVNIVRNINSDDVLKLGSGSVLIHDRNQIDINAKQIQQINQGHMTNTAGFLSLNLIKDKDRLERYASSRFSPNYRMKRGFIRDNQDLTNYMKIVSEYSINMISKKSKREARQEDDEFLESNKKSEYISESLITKTSTVSLERDRIQQIKEKLANLFGASAFNFLGTFVDRRTSSYRVLLEAIEFESSHLKQANDKDSIRSLVNNVISGNELRSFCGYETSLNLKKCQDVLVLLYKSGNSAALELLISAIPSKSVEVVKILAENNYPSLEIMDKLLEFYENKKIKDNNLKGMLILLMSNLLSKTRLDNNLRNRFFNITDTESKNIGCKNFLTIDILESMGNLNEPRNIPRIIEIVEKCKSSQGHLIASIHAIRKMLNSRVVQKWLLLKLKDQSLDCSVKREIVITLREAANNFNKNYQKDQTWPRKGFNSIDTTLDEINHSTTPAATCLREHISNYFLAKEDPFAMVISWDLKKKMGTKKKKREISNPFWDHHNCREWSIGSNISEIDSDKEIKELKKNDSTLELIKRKKCTSIKYFGPKQAQTIFGADITTDILTPSYKSEYLLTAQFSVSSYFLGKEIDIGKMYMYQRKDFSRAYISLFGQTLLDSKKNNCDWQTIDPYRFSTFVPLYGVNVWMVNLDLGLRLKGEMMVDSTSSKCKAEIKSDEIVEIQPEVSLRVSGEGVGLILFVKGGIDIGGEFNYQTNLKFKADPRLCLSAHSGYKPMNISIQSWFQIWDVSCRDWSPRTVFKPTQLNWKLKGQKNKPWIKNECLLKEKAV